MNKNVFCVHATEHVMGKNSTHFDATCRSLTIWHVVPFCEFFACSTKSLGENFLWWITAVTRT